MKLLVCSSLFVSIFALRQMELPTETPTLQIHEYKLATDSVNYADYVGNYRGPSGSPVEFIAIDFKDGKLFASAMGQTSELSPTGTTDVFMEPNYNAKMHFVRNDQKVVTKMRLIVEAMQLDLELKKEQ
ncbi:MAG: hypothetical protein ACK4HE_06945 [Chitinophagaceae bacterium]